MGKLSHIDDVEQRAQRQAAGQQATTGQSVDARRQPGASFEEDMTASEEEAFHGLDSSQPMGVGHKVLIILAVIVVAVAVLYIVNSWIHFI